jgi:hypothetical protein
MAAEGLIEFEELRAQLAALEAWRRAQSTWRNWSVIETACWITTLTSCPKRLTLWDQRNATGCIE